jgi:hypothetical protein
MEQKPVDRPDRETLKVRQGTGPRAMVAVLLISTIAALVAVAAVVLYYYAGPASPPKV